MARTSRYSPATDYSRADLAEELARLAALPDAPVPGTSYEYSNLGVGLLGVALADGLGLADFDALVHSRLLDPIGMSDTGTRVPAFMDRLGDRLAQGYVNEGGVLVPVDVSDMGVLAGAGEILSTGDDMALFMGNLIGLDSALAAGSVEEALQPLEPSAGGRWIGYCFDIVAQPDGATNYEKGGVAGGFTTFVAFRRTPDTPVGVTILSNRQLNPAIPAAARQILDVVALDAAP